MHSKHFWNITSTSLTEENAAKKLFFFNALLSKPVHFIAWNYCLSGGKIFQLKTSQSYLIVWYTKQRNSWSLWKKNLTLVSGEWWVLTVTRPPDHLYHTNSRWSSNFSLSKPKELRTRSPCTLNCFEKGLGHTLILSQKQNI